MSDPRSANPRAHGSSRLWRYGVAVIGIGLAALLTELLWPAVHQIPLMMFLTAVMVSAWYGGLGPGLLATALSIFTVEYYFVQPAYTFGVGPEDLVRIGSFVTVAVLISSLTTARRHAEGEARRSEARLLATLSSIGDAVIAADTEGRVTFINPVAQQLTGWNEDDAKGRQLSEVFKIIDEETRTPLNALVATVMSEGDATNLMRRAVLLARDGSEIPISDSGAPIKDAAGEVVGIVLSFQNVTERRRVEQERSQLAAIVESSTDAIIGKTLEGIITSWNTGAARIYGYAPEEVIGRHISIIAPPERNDEIALILERIRNGGRVEHMETVRVRKDGVQIEISVTISPIRDGTGRIAGAATIARDITARKRTDKALRESEARFRIAARSASDLIFEWDVRGGTMEWFGSIDTHLGYPPGEFPRTVEAWKQIIHPEDRDRVLAAIERHLQEREPFHEDYRVIRRDGTVLYWTNRGTALWDEDGNAYKWIGVTSDITERKRAEEERAQLLLREQEARAEAEESERRYRFLAESLPQIVWTARPDGWVDYYNHRWYEYTGMSPEQAEGWGWQPMVHPDDVAHVLRSWATSVHTGTEYEGEWRLRRAADNAYRWHLVRSFPLYGPDGQLLKWLGTATDIDDQKRAEESSRFLAEASEMLASSLDYQTVLSGIARLAVPHIADWCIVDVLNEDGTIHNTTAHADPSKEDAARRLAELYPRNPDAPFGSPRVLRTGRPEVIAEVTEPMLETLACDDEHLRVLREMNFKSYICVPLLSRGRTLGSITLVMAESGRRYTARDLTFAESLAHRAALAVENARLFRQTQSANRAKDEFLATLSHELRTPLTPIIGWTHMLRNGKLQLTDAEQGLAVIDKNSQALARLINDLLDMSSILSGKMRIERVPVSLDAVVREATDTVRAEADKHGVSIETNIICHNGDEPPTVLGDRTRLVQVLWNLLNNAVKFSNAGGSVRVSCSANHADAHIIVEDDGRGIAPDFLPYVFERFRQADGTTTRVYGGLGIGLALVKSFVEAHGGTATADSRGEGHGSRFTVTLPLLHPAVPAPHQEEGSSVSVDKTEPASRHVLIVEDALDTLEMLDVVFRARGYQTTVCETASEALRIAPSMCFDIIVSDIGLPQLDGYDLIKRLRDVAHLRDVPAVALTGYAAQKDAETALAAGFDLHVAKPVDPTALADMVEQLLQERRSK